VKIWTPENLDENLDTHQSGREARIAGEKLDTHQKAGEKLKCWTPIKTTIAKSWTPIKAVHEKLDTHQKGSEKLKS